MCGDKWPVSEKKIRRDPRFSGWIVLSLGSLFKFYRLVLFHSDWFYRWPWGIIFLAADSLISSDADIIFFLWGQVLEYCGFGRAFRCDVFGIFHITAPAVVDLVSADGFPCCPGNCGLFFGSWFQGQFGSGERTNCYGDFFGCFLVILSSGSCDSECNFTRSYRDNLSSGNLDDFGIEDFRVILPSVSAVKTLVFLVLWFRVTLLAVITAGIRALVMVKVLVMEPV